jgi:hypothetical protein
MNRESSMYREGKKHDIVRERIKRQDVTIYVKEDENHAIK